MTSTSNINRCQSCGAAVARTDHECPYCNSPLIWSSTLRDHPSRAEIFEKLKASSAYGQRQDQERVNVLALQEASRQLNRINPWILLLFVMAVLVSLGSLLIGLWPVPLIIVGSWWLYRKFTGTPPLVSQAVMVDGQPEPALIITKRTQVYGTGSNVTTRYFVTAELEDGTRHELETLGPTLYGDICEGDAGIIFSNRQRTKLVFFDRVRL